MITDEKISIILNQEDCYKIKVMQKAISDITTPEQIMGGLIDGGFATALKTLYADGLITDVDYCDDLKLLPEWFRKAIKNKKS